MKTLTQHLLESMDNRTWIFTIVKPGFLEYTPDIINIFKKHGWSVAKVRTTKLLRSQAVDLYHPLSKEDFFPNLCDYMSSGLSTAIIYEHPTLPQKEAYKVVADIKDGIRDKWGVDDCRNVMHSSDSYSNMERESSIYF